MYKPLLQNLKLISLILLATTLSGCFLFKPYRMDQQQGNLFTQKEVAQLHRGLNKDEVRRVMGNPVLESIFDDNHWDYVYTFQHSHNPIQKMKVSLIFKNNRLVSITKDMHS